MDFKFTKQPSSAEVTVGTHPYELHRLLSQLAAGDSFQVWITDAHDNSVAFLANASHAYVSSLPTSEDWLAAYVPGNLSTAVVGIYLENGQLDKFAEGDCVPREAAIIACIEYMETGVLPTSLEWRRT